jgi:hypothetical protein
MTTSENFITSQKVNAFSAIAYFRKKNRFFDLKLSATYGENTTDFLVIGGFAVLDTIDVAKKEVRYTPLRNITAWIDMSTVGKTCQLGIFAGYNRNIGTGRDIHGGIHGYYTNIKYLYRISPRINYYIKNFQIGIEFESTICGYGNDGYNEKAVPINAKKVVNYRILLGVYYNF